MDLREKDVLTTGEAAKICHVAPRTVSKWFDSGKLQGYRIPGSKDRRIPVSALLQFMRNNNIPLDGVYSGKPRILIVENEVEVANALRQHLTDESHAYDVCVAESTFAAGIECEKFRPHVILLNIHLGDIDAARFARSVRTSEDLAVTRIVAMSSRLTDGQIAQLKSQGIDGCLKKPFTLRQAIEEIERVHSLVH